MSPRIAVADKWEILIKLIGLDLAEDFLYMGDSGMVFLFKHNKTKQYINIDEAGNLYRYADFCHRRIPDNEKQNWLDYVFDVVKAA